jgi:predicted membrane-bound spermidine synthase
VFVTVAAELFGTNLRATAATTAPNFVRGSVTLITLLFASLKPIVGIIRSAEITGALVLVIALVALFFVDETYGRDLDFVEE